MSPTLAAQGLVERDASGRRPHVETLERLVARRAGTRRRAQWFRVQGDEALGLDHRADPPLQGRRLTRADLPPLSLRHALLVDALWRLYPGVLDSELIQRARIEARLRRSAA